MWASSPRLTAFASADAKKMPFVFPGGVYVGKNFARLARLRAEPQPPQQSGSTTLLHFVYIEMLAFLHICVTI
jgi:hypothetical protein